MKTITLPFEKVNFVFTTDWHLSDVAPGRRAGSYASDILGKIAFVGELAHKMEAVSLCGGDVFHAKSARSYGNTFSLVSRLIRILDQYPRNTVYGTHGNHDLWMDRTDSLPLQPFGVLTSSGVFEDISDRGGVIFENASGSVRVQVDAYPYADDMVTLDRVLNAAPREAQVNYRVVLMHQYGNPGNQGSLHGLPTIGYNQMAESDYDMALWGHDHSRADTVTVGNTTHIRLGSLSRASLSMDEVDRPVNAAVISFSADRVRLKEVPVPVNPLEISFAAADNEVERARKTDEVVEFFQEMDVAVDSIESTDAEHVLRDLCPKDEPKVLDMAVQYCFS
jgi:DNA repair exonuclease SbcCD nuclease subunit